MDVRSVLRDVLKRIRPTEEEQRKVREVSRRLLSLLEEMKGKYVRVVLAGSAARNTNLRGSSDLDVFLVYPRSVPREEMEQEVLKIGKEILERMETRYAEHPYVHGTFDGIEVDLVPAYEMKKGERIKSATDRTPLHQEFVTQHCRGKMCDEIRLLKAFLKGIGVYGAEIRVQGFSGYLAELLVIHYGSFLDVLHAAADWRPPVFVPITEPAVRFNDPLIVPDPVDPYRNVAAPVSLKSLATFVAASRAFLDHPSLSFFFPEPPLLSTEDVRRILSLRSLLFVLFPFPSGASPDIFWGEIRHMEEKVCGRLRTLGYSILYSEAWTDEKEQAALGIELSHTPSSIYEKHEGPPVFNKTHSDRFLEKHKNAAFGPWIEGGRWYVLRLRPTFSPAVALYEAVMDYREHSAKEPLKSALLSFEVLPGRAILPHYTSNKELAMWVSSFLLRKPLWL